MDFHTPGSIVATTGRQPTVAELEAENTRLQRLVADLLIKNQQLRVELKAAQRPPSFALNFGKISNN